MSEYDHRQDNGDPGRVVISTMAGEVDSFAGEVTIHRFDLPPSEETIEVITYRGARFLPHVVPSDRISNGFTIWAVVPVGARLRPRYLWVLGTGDTVPADQIAQCDYLGTFNTLRYVFHVFVNREAAA